MRILLFSDSHGNVHNMSKAVKKNKDIDLVVHLGDFLSDAIKLKEIYTDIRLECVYGNNDWTREYPAEKVLDLQGKKVFICHGHQYGVKNGYQRIISKGKAIKADAVFFGHTHINEEIYSDGMLVLNPGSVGLGTYFHRPTYAVVEVDQTRVYSRFYSV